MSSLFLLPILFLIRRPVSTIKSYLVFGRLTFCFGRFRFLGKKNCITVGRNLTINDRVSFTCRCSIVIGDNVILSEGVSVYDCGLEPLSVINMNKPYYQSAPVFIDSHVWIGAHAIILPGVTIGHNSIIGAGSVVTKDVPPRSIACGNPAVVLKTYISE